MKDLVCQTYVSNQIVKSTLFSSRKPNHCIELDSQQLSDPKNIIWHRRDFYSLKKKREIQK